jgi:hypothetical protein
MALMGRGEWLRWATTEETLRLLLVPIIRRKRHTPNVPTSLQFDSTVSRLPPMGEPGQNWLQNYRRCLVCQNAVPPKATTKHRKFRWGLVMRLSTAQCDFGNSFAP